MQTLNNKYVSWHLCKKTSAIPKNEINMIYIYIFTLTNVKKQNNNECS